MTEDQLAVQQHCDDFATAMRAMDVVALSALWDQRFEHLVYQPEEYAGPCRSWDEIVAYWSHIPEVVERISEWRNTSYDIAVLGDCALAYVQVTSSFDLHGESAPLAGQARFTFGLRRTADGWRFVHCHESRQLIVD
jgi:ketosteroid isomerase-like protein